MRTLSPLVPVLLLSGCLRTYHRPTCEEVSVTEVADDEPTDAGTVTALLDRIEVDADLDATWQDGAPTSAHVDVRRGAGPGEWVVLEPATEVTRSWGIGSSSPDIYVSCANHLRVPVEASVDTPDGELSMAVSGEVHVSSPAATVGGEGTLRESFSGPYGDAVLPDGEADPDDFVGKHSFVLLVYDEAGLAEGAAGWDGERTTAEFHESHAEYLLDFVGADEATTPP